MSNSQPPITAQPSANSVDRCASGFVLAGGQSSRMGSDKAVALFDGSPLITNAVQIFKSAGLSVKIAGSRSNLSQFSAEIPETIPDTFPESGPLGGVHSALAASSSEWNVFLPVDMPLMPPSLLAALLLRAQRIGTPVTVPKLNGRIEPFPVVLSLQSLPIIESRLQSLELGCQSAWHAISAHLDSRLDGVSVESLVQTGHCRHPASFPPIWWFQSANTPAELTWLNHIHAKISPESRNLVL